MSNVHIRQLFALGFSVCAAAMSFALYLQYFRGFEPCPMCVFQRVAMIATGLIFLAGALHGPKAGGRWAYGIAAALAAGAGAGIAGRQVWLQSLPPGQAPACGPTLDYLVDMLPFTEVLMTVLKGDGNCAIIDAAFFGIPLPGWTLITFIALAIYAVLIPAFPKFISRHSRESGNPV